MIRPATRRTRPSKPLVESGDLLAGLVAQSHADARAHLLEQLTLCDGYGERGESVAVHTSGVSNPTASAALARDEITARLDALTARERETADAVRRHLWANQADMRYRAPQDATAAPTAKLCCDGLTDSTRPGAIEWFDPTCKAGAVTRGLCRKHYNAMYYWRSTHGLEPVPETEAPMALGIVRSTAEVVIRDGYLGAVHVMAATANHHVS